MSKIYKKIETKLKTKCIYGMKRTLRGITNGVKKYV